MSNTFDAGGQRFKKSGAPAVVLERRPPAHRSVSLKHKSRSPEVQEKPLAARDPTRAPRSSGSSLVNNKASSGESSNAETWFDQSNKNVPKGTSVGDISPPFFVQHSSTDDASAAPPQTSISLPFRSAGLAQIGSMGSSSEEYRSVIDDLTIKNKRLKKRLQGYERLREHTLASETMFEVKIKGLSREKKRELEKLLSDFAMNANNKVNIDAGVRPQAFSNPAPTSLPPKPSSSLTSTRAADSGYGSMAASNQGLSNARSSDTGRVASNLDQSKAKDRNIHSYLHDIPEGLLPKPPNVMTEKAKKKLVVQRLEQIFGGRGASAEGHQQPLQQQKVSNSAAEDDRMAIEASGQRAAAEGKREAFIMNQETEEPMDLSRDNHSDENNGTNSAGQQQETAEDEIEPPSSPLPEQRPTRPLDLDPHRAQIPAENITYIRHLGFEFPDADAQAQVVNDQGWLYLNLMVNLAQLHTINVTTDFVRQSVREYSDRFELSADGRKVRWKSKQPIAKARSNSMSGADASTSSFTDDREKQIVGEKRARPVTLDRSSSYESSNVPKRRLNEISAYESFAYTPIFKQTEHNSDNEDISMADDESDYSPLPDAGESSAFATSSRYTGSGSKRQDDGPLVFYKNRAFFTDLSGDRVKPASPSYSAGSRSVTHQTLGGATPRSKAVKSSIGGSTTSRRTRRYFATDAATPPYSSSARPISQAPDSGVTIDVDTFSPRHVTFVEAKDVASFDVSGIGGAYFRDNTNIHVVRGITAGGPRKPSKRGYHKLANIVPGRQQGAATEKIISVRKIILEPSELPEASYAFNAEESDDDDTSSENSDSDGGQLHDSLQVLPSTTLVHSSNRSMADSIGEDESGGDSASDDEDSEEESSDDGELDFLATARAVDPVAIRAREREYDAAMAERLADEIPAGSSAATAGGGSGFNSPVGRPIGRPDPFIRHTEDAGDAGSVSS